MKPKYDVNTIQIMASFEKITGAHLKDCFEHNERLYFVVQPDHLGKAIGKNAKNLPRLEKHFNRKIKIVKFDSNKHAFLRNLLFPVVPESITEEEGIITIRGKDRQTKGLMIGPRAQNLRTYEKIMNRHFDVKEIKVI